jgi:DNA-binding beta-propeller fold protein YncE
MDFQKDKMGMIPERALLLGVMALSIVAASLALAASALADAPDFVLRMPQSEELPGLSDEAGGTNNPRGIVGSPSTGHVYVASLENGRVNEYTAWGAFVKSWGWDVAPEGALGDTPTNEFETCGPATPEAKPSAGICQGGDEGGGRGQFSGAMGLALDATDNVYVLERTNRRVQKFSPEGEFLVMFGGDVNKTKVDGGAEPADRNVCPVDSADVCQAGISGEGPSQLDTTPGDFIAYSPALDAILVGDKGRIQIFDLDGTYREEIVFEGPLAPLAGKQVNGLDVDKDSSIYISLDDTEDVYKLSPTGEPLTPGKPGESSFKAQEPLGVAVDVQGSVYAINDPEGIIGGAPPHVLKFSATGEGLVPTVAEENSGELFPERTPEARLTAIATNICADGTPPDSEAPGNLYIGFFNAGISPQVSYADAYGTGPLGCEPPPPNPPTIGEQFATSVGRGEATLRALINPRFFPDVTYYVEYGTGDCSAGGCPNAAPFEPAPLTDRTVSTFISTASVLLEGLAPGTTYHYRFVTKSSGGGPVFGIDPDGEGPLPADEDNGLGGTFRTHAAQATQAPCPNDALRVGPGSDLPDCRAYEMVSPLEKGNADVALGIGRNNASYRFFETNKSALSAERFTFSAAIAFADAKSAPFASQYLAERGAAGWGSEAISAPRTEPGIAIDFNFGPEFQGFTDDLCRSWLRLYSVAPIATGAVPKYSNLYRRENCVEPATYAALTTEPPSQPPEKFINLLIKGFSADGSRTIFTAPDRLDPAVPKTGQEELYEQTPQGLRFVCYLPSGKASSEPCSAGTSARNGFFDVSSVRNAISADGARIFWTAYTPAGASSNPGRIYVRIEGKETRAVSAPVSPEPAFFWTAAGNGSKAIFSFTAGTQKGELYEFDVDAEKARQIAAGVEGPMGASEDASRLYFASSEDLDGAGPAAAGDHNLYFYEADSGGGSGTYEFIMALTARDVGFVGPAYNGPPTRPIEFSPAFRAARVTPDGLHATFVSTASPTPGGYDNREATSGKAALEVYRYDAAAGELACVSCNPTRARPAAVLAEAVMSAARIQGWEANNRAPRVISDDGSRIFFESHEPLVPEDSNATWDVYQWEEPGAGSCTTASPTYGHESGGCVEPISSGQSPSRSLFLDADRSGASVFFATQSSLVGADYGLNDVYVARVGGGFPEPVPPGECEGEACQSPPPPPAVVTPVSKAFRGPGDKAGKRRKCAKGKRRVLRKGRARCVKRRNADRRGPRKGNQRKGSRR